VVCRVCLGLPEAAFYPGAMFLLSRWYTKKVVVYMYTLPFLVTDVCNSQELTFRSAFLYAGGLTANAFGSVSDISLSFSICSYRVNDQVIGSWDPSQYGRQTGDSSVAMVGRALVFTTLHPSF